MFGMSFTEILVIAVVAIIALGPEKLPQAMVEIAKYMKLLRKTVNDAKQSFEQEVRIAELKEDAKKYKENITKSTESVRKKLTFDELEELKSSVSEVTSSVNKNLGDIKKAATNPAGLAKDKLSDSAKNFMNGENKDNKNPTNDSPNSNSQDIDLTDSKGEENV